MDTNKRIRIFYILSIVGIVIGFLISGLALISFTSSQYGEYNLYLNYMIQLGVLSFGFQDGMLINYRKKKYEDMLPTLKRDLNFGFVFQTIVLILSLVLIPMIFKVDQNSNQYIILILSILSFYPATLMGNIRNSFSALGKFDIIGYFDFFTKIYMLGGIIVVTCFDLNVIIYMIIDIVFKCLIVIVLYIKIYYDYKKLDIKEEKEVSSFSIKDNFKKGLLVLLGNWAYVLVFSLDKTFLQDNTSLLGIYSYSLFVLTTLYQMFIPIKSVIVSMINEKLSSRELFNISFKVTTLIFSVVLLYLWIGEPIILSIVDSVGQSVPGIVDKLSDIVEGIKLSDLITIGMPFYIVVHLIFMSLLLVKDQKKFAVYGFINAAITFIIYYVFVRMLNISPLVGVCLATVMNYLVTYLFNGLLVIGLKEGIKLVLISIAMVILCFVLVTLKNNFLYALVVIPLVVLVLKTIIKKEYKE